MNRFVRACALAATVLLLASPMSTAAQTWRSQSSPLRVYEDGVAQGGGYGTFNAAAVSGGVKVSNAGSLKDFKPTGNSIYHETRYSFFTCGSGCGAAPGGQFQSTRWNGDYWKLFTPSETTSLSSAYDYARGAIIVCEDQKLSPDPCSAQFVTGYDYF